MRWKVILLVSLMVLSLSVPVASGERWYDQKNDYVKLKTYPTYDNSSGFDREFQWDTETKIIDNVTSGDNLQVPDKWEVSSDMELYMEMDSVQAKTENASIDKSISLDTGETYTENFDGDRNVTGYVNLTSVDKNMYDNFTLDSGFPAKTSASNNVTVNDNNITANGSEAWWQSVFFDKTVDSHQLRREVDEVFSYGNGTTIYIRQNDTFPWTSLTSSAGVFKQFQLRIVLSYSEISPSQSYFGGYAKSISYDSDGNQVWSNDTEIQGKGGRYSPTEGVFFVCTSTGGLYAFDGSNGDYIGNISLDGNNLDYLDISGKRELNSGIYTRDIVVCGGYNIYHVLYKYSEGSPLGGHFVKTNTYTYGSYPDGVGLTLHHNNGYPVYYVTVSGTLEKHYLSNNTLIYSKSAGDTPNDVIPDAKSGGCYFETDWDNTGNFGLHKFDENGNIVWQTKDISNYAGSFTIGKDYIYYTSNDVHDVKIYHLSNGTHWKDISLATDLTGSAGLAVDSNGYMYVNTESPQNQSCVRVSDGTTLWKGESAYAETRGVAHAQGSVWHTDTAGEYNSNYIGPSEPTIGKFKSLNISWKDTVDFELNGELFTAKSAGFSHAVDKTDVEQIQIYNRYGLNSFKENLDVEYPLLKDSEVSPLPITVTVKGDNGTLAEKTFNVEYGEPLEGVIENVNYTKVKNISTSVDISGYSAKNTIVDFSKDTMEFMFKVEFYYETVSSGYFNFVDAPTFWAVFISLLLTIAVGVKTKNADVSAFAFTSLIGIMFVLGFVHAFVLYVTLFSFGLLYVIKVRRKDW